ncbi:hypothetical protein PMH09_15365 [Roseofilum sp. BLCC_M143]|uniref:Uncharacterized protein n=1 Tax=Roseofilum casamattae BLCC-M143 TaxID=3022442 RepID=A0ABT7BZT0_9CYAN|nr:hypothetical protein [Roseofilum casamattae BLCC-M143]
MGANLICAELGDANLLGARLERWP